MERIKQRSVNGAFDEEYNQLKQKLHIVSIESNLEETKLFNIKY